MRVLVGHTNQMPEILLHRPLPGRENCQDAILAFGNGYQQVTHEPGMAWADLLARCPAGWKPDVYIHWSLEYNAVPDGIEHADCLTVGVVGDWNLGGQALHAIGGAFDALFADRNGCELLRRAGFSNVHYAPLWAFNPSQHRRLPGVERDIDVLMIGNFNHAVQRERARWLARAARLSRKHRVVLTSGIFGEEYVRAMNRAKIVFNRSIRGEINMRAYEAPACGALLFYEAENAEIRALFTDREHCVLYDTSNLEALLDYYLAPENAAERERIAEAGWRRVQDHTYAHHFAQMLSTLEPLIAAKRAQAAGSAPRAFCQLSVEERRARRAAQWLLSSDRRVYPKVVALLAPPSETRDQWKAEPESANQQAVLYGEWANCLPPSPEREARLQQAIASAQRALEIAPNYLLARANLGFLYLVWGRAAEGEAALRDVAGALETENVEAAQLRGVYFPRRFETFDVEAERIWGQFTPGTPAWRDKFKTLLAWRVHTALAETAYARGDFLLSLRHAGQAAACRPELGETQYLLARALRACGQVEEAVAAYRRALEEAPFLLTAWEELAQLLLDLARADEALALLEEWAALLEGCPIYAPVRAACNRLRYQAKQLARQATAPAPPLTRLLAFPNWQEPAQWQALVRAFAAAYRPIDPALLMLRADPHAHPPTEDLLRALEAFLVRDLGLPASALPNITLLNQPLAPEDAWKLFHVADAVIVGDAADLSPQQAAYAAAAHTPLWTLEEMRARRAA